MSHNDHLNARREPSQSQDGFSLIEVLVATTVMLVIVGAVFTLMGSSMKLSMSTYEMTEAQQNLRIAHEYINRDIMNAGDGLKSIDGVRMPTAFYQTYIALIPIPAPTPAGIAKLAIFTSENNLAAGVVVNGTPGGIIRTNTDRQTILALDSEFNTPPCPAPCTTPPGGAPITLSAIPADGSTVTLPAGQDMSLFTIGEVYLFASGIRATFGTITAINSGARRLSFAAGDTYGLNAVGGAGHITWVQADPSINTTLQRMKIIQYYVTTTGLLMRRVFGVQGAGYRASVVAEHVVNVQFNYSLIIKDPATGVVTPSQTNMLTTSEQQLAVRQVEVTITVETPHRDQNNKQPQIKMMTATSVRNMQFRRAL